MGIVLVKVEQSEIDTTLANLYSAGIQRSFINGHRLINRQTPIIIPVHNILGAINTALDE